MKPDLFALLLGSNHRESQIAKHFAAFGRRDPLKLMAIQADEASMFECLCSSLDSIPYICLTNQVLRIDNSNRNIRELSASLLAGFVARTT